MLSHRCRSILLTPPHLLSLRTRCKGGPEAPLLLKAPASLQFNRPTCTKVHPYKPCEDRYFDQLAYIQSSSHCHKDAKQRAPGRKQVSAEAEAGLHGGGEVAKPRNASAPQDIANRFAAASGRKRQQAVAHRAGPSRCMRVDMVFSA